MVTLANRTESVVIDIGGMPVLLRTTERAFAELLEERYSGFVNPFASPTFDIEVTLVPSGVFAGEEDVKVRQRSGCWSLERGDFRAEWDPASRQGSVRQSANPYAIDSVLRILHTLLLASEGGFLVHAASAVRSGRALLFAGRSGAGKTTLARLAPPEVTLLSDEISYVRRLDEGYQAFGTPFSGELARLAENLSAPLAALYVLEKGPGIKIEPLAEADAVNALLQNILFFAEDAQLVERVFASACEFIRRVPAYRLTFAPSSRVWEALG